MLYVQLDVTWADDPRVMEAGVDGAGLHALAMCIAKRMPTDGVLHRTHLLRAGGTEELIDRLVSVGLLDDLGERRIFVRGWLGRNKSQAEIANHRTATDATRSAKSASGREGNHTRWDHPGPVEECPKCNPDNDRKSDPESSRNSWSVAGATPESSQGSPQAIAPESHCDRKSSLKTETETEEETEPEERKVAEAPAGQARLAIVSSSPAATPRPSMDTMVHEVFDAWVGATGKRKAKLDNKRRGYIERRLRDGFAVADLVDAVRGWKHDPFHRGENDRNTAYNGIHLLLKDAEHVERFRDLERVPSTRPGAAGRHARAAGHDVAAPADPRWS